jgi:hypothetical protein
MPNRSNLGFRWEDFSLEDLRLEHELQTVAGSSARRCRDFFRLLTASARHCSGSVARHWHARHARGSGCPLSRGYRRRLLVPPSSAPFWRRRGSKAASALVPGYWGAVAADVPDALTRHNRKLSPSASLHKALHGELASHLWALARFQQVPAAPGPLLPRFKIPLTTRP